MSLGSSTLVRRGLVTLTSAAVLTSSLLGVASNALAQDSTPAGSPSSSPVASPAASPAAVTGTPVDVAGCWPDASVGKWMSMADGYTIFEQWSTPPQMVIDPAGHYTAIIHTTAGDITVQLLASDAPVTVNNFICLAGHGFYDKTKFHRIIAGFVIQGGDPTGTGTGGPGYQFADELPGDGLDYTAGTLAMANAGANTNGSQWFITLADLSGRLPKNYTIFGKVIGGMDIVTALGNTPVTTSATGEASAPTQPVGITGVTVVQNP
ncbi:MAG: peptidylprolyl isomerase [Thermomicrobiales bacterium]